MSWKAEYILLILFSTLVDYSIAILIEKSEKLIQKKVFLGLSLLTNLGLLFAFKYFNFFSDSTRIIFEKFDIFYNIPTFDLLLPVGISFYTFQTLSYSIDVYKGRQKAERHLGIFALYVSFFPQLVAGPIERAGKLLPQFREKTNVDIPRILDGLQLMGWGIFKKVVIADRLAIYVNLVFNSPGEHSPVQFIIAAYFFAFQIYCDFSGYSDVAIGAARIFGYDLMENFRRPYFAKSIQEFWQRWHISLSTWFRDYLYIPLGGSRTSKIRLFLNILIVFSTSGLWHGANWTFVIWGLLHGIAIVIGNMKKAISEKIYRLLGITKFPNLIHWIKIAITFHIVVASWIFFRANSVNDAFYIFSQLVRFDQYTLNNLCTYCYSFGLSFWWIGALFIVQLIQRKKSIRQRLLQYPVPLRVGVYIGMILLFALFGAFNNPQQFIYFQF